MFIPPGEKIIETRKCRISGEDFVITDMDIDFYELLSPVIGGQKYAIPFPTLCPQERLIRRMTWRNYDKFYRNTCAISGKEIIATYRSESPYKVLSLETWWGDDFDSHAYKKTIDFSRPFFDQFRELDQLTMHLPVSVTKCENSDFTNFSISNHNCYLCARVAECENCYYSFLIARCKNCIDVSNCSDSEYLYECIRTDNSYHCFSCIDCDNCRDCWFLTDCSSCQDCFGSCNLRNARYVFNNKQLAEEEYRNSLTKIIPGIGNITDVREKFSLYSTKFPKKFMAGFNNENVCGNSLVGCSDIVFGFECHGVENARYVFGGHGVKDAMDITFGYTHEKSLEICGGTGGYAQFFSINNLTDCRDLLYSKDCALGTRNCFGCISLKKGKHCILNSSYSQLEYEDTVSKLIHHMQSTDEWGEFFPAEHSPHGYNETAAHAHFPKTKEQALQLGWTWFEESIPNASSKMEPLGIDQYDEKKVGFHEAQKNIDSLLGATLTCQKTGRAFKIIKPELAFYIENSLPIPREHHLYRSEIRMRKSLPMELHSRSCDECGHPFLTSYAPGRPEKILCEECYRKLVY